MPLIPVSIYSPFPPRASLPRAALKPTEDASQAQAEEAAAHIKLSIQMVKERYDEMFRGKGGGEDVDVGL